MGPDLPPAPPAHIMTIDEVVRLAAGKSPRETVTLGDVLDLLAAVSEEKSATSAAELPPRRVPLSISAKTKGRRDASLRSRSNRRKK